MTNIFVIPTHSYTGFCNDCTNKNSQVCKGCAQGYIDDNHNLVQFVEPTRRWIEKVKEYTS